MFDGTCHKQVIGKGRASRSARTNAAAGTGKGELRQRACEDPFHDCAILAALYQVSAQLLMSLATILMISNVHNISNRHCDSYHRHSIENTEHLEVETSRSVCY